MLGFTDDETQSAVGRTSVFACGQVLRGSVTRQRRIEKGGCKSRRTSHQTTYYCAHYPRLGVNRGAQYLLATNKGPLRSARDYRRRLGGFRTVRHYTRMARDFMSFV